MYKLSREELKEVAADLLQCSTEQIRMRTRFCRKGEAIAENDCKVYFAMSLSNPYAKANANADGGFNMQQQYNDSRFSLQGVGVWITDRECFFFTKCIAAPDPFVYVEFEKY